MLAYIISPDYTTTSTLILHLSYKTKYKNPVHSKKEIKRQYLTIPWISRANWDFNIIYNHFLPKNKSVFIPKTKYSYFLNPNPGSEEWWKGRWKSEGKDGIRRKDGYPSSGGGGGGYASAREKSSTAGGGSTPRTLTIEAWSSQSRVAVTVDGATVNLATIYVPFFSFSYFSHNSQFFFFLSSSLKAKDD